MKWGISQSCNCLDHGQILTLLNISVQEQRNPLRVSEVVHESSTRISVIVPGHPDSPSRGRTDNTNNICNGVLAESKSTMGKVLKIKHNRLILVNLSIKKGPWVDIPLSKNVPFVQGIAFFKKRGYT